MYTTSSGATTGGWTQIGFVIPMTVGGGGLTYNPNLSSVYFSLKLTLTEKTTTADSLTWWAVIGMFVLRISALFRSHGADVRLAN